MTTRWVEQLAELDRNNRYFLFCPRKEVLPASLQRICLQKPNFSWVEVAPGFTNRLPSKVSFLLRDQLLIPIAASANKCRLIFFPYFNPSLCLLPRAIVCVTDFSIYLDRKNYSFLQRIYYNSLLKAAAKGARGLLAISKATQADANRYLAVPAQRIAVVHPGVEEYFYPVPQDEARAWCQTHYGLNFPYVLYSGGYDRRKNLRRLVEAFKKAKERVGPDLKLVMTGRQDESSEFFLWLQSEHPSLAVLLGRVPEEALRYLYSAAELAVYPSLYEGFGLPILEAQACGVPVVSSNVTSMPEVAGGAAILADPHDEMALAEAIVKGLTDHSLRSHLIRQGLENSRKFTWAAGARKLLEIFENIKLESAK